MGKQLVLSKDDKMCLPAPLEVINEHDSYWGFFKLYKNQTTKKHIAQNVALFLSEFYILLAYHGFLIFPSNMIHMFYLACTITLCSSYYMWHATLINRPSSLWGNSVPLCIWQPSQAHLLSNGLCSLCLSSDADLCQSNAGSCILDESLVCIYPLTPPPPSPPSLFPPLSLSSFFLRRHFNMYANGLRSTGKICVESCPAVRRCRRDCVCIYEAWALPLLGEKTLWVAGWRLCSAGRMQICQ